MPHRNKPHAFILSRIPSGLDGKAKPKSITYIAQAYALDSEQRIHKGQIISKDLGDLAKNLVGLRLYFDKTRGDEILTQAKLEPGSVSLETLESYELTEFSSRFKTYSTEYLAERTHHQSTHTHPKHGH